MVSARHTAWPPGPLIDISEYAGGTPRARGGQLPRPWGELGGDELGSGDLGRAELDRGELGGWQPGNGRPGRASLEFQILGPVEVLRGGRPVPLPGRTTVVTVAGLLLTPNRIVPVDTLIEWIWGGALPARPRTALQSCISRLRRLLGADLVETAALGYRITIDAGQLDLTRFNQFVAAAGRAGQDGAAEAALASLDQALRLWRGTPLSNVDSPALHRDAIPGLNERYLRVVEQRSSLCLRLGRYSAVVQELSAVVHQHPFHERLAGQLMVALVKSGRRGDALAAYSRLRQALTRELGIDPSPALETLQATILRADRGWEVRDWPDWPEWLREF
jgi:DNA-binding SARP family transcriptional activator